MTNFTSVTDKFAHQVGMGVMTYGQLESDLRALFCLMANIDFQTGLRIWSAIEFRPQRDILQSLSVLKLDGNPIQGEFGRVIGEVKKANNTRNKLSHWSWAKDVNTEEMIWISIDNRTGFKVKFEKTSYESLVENVNQIGSAREAVRALTEKIKPAIDAWHRKHHEALPEAPGHEAG